MSDAFYKSSFFLNYLTLVYDGEQHTTAISCFPDNKRGLILIFTPKFTLGLTFGNVLF